MKECPDLYSCKIISTRLERNATDKITVYPKKWDPDNRLHQKDKARMLEIRRDAQTAITQLVANHRLSLSPLA